MPPRRSKKTSTFLRENEGVALSPKQIPSTVLQLCENEQALLDYGFSLKKGTDGTGQEVFSFFQECATRVEPLIPKGGPVTVVRHPNVLGGYSPKEIANTLFQGDCLKILPALPAHSVSLILCDLPYGTTQNAWDSVIPLKQLWHEYWRVLTPNGVVVLTAQGLFTAKLILSQPEAFKYKIIWTKSKPTNFLNAKKQPLRRHEDVCVFYHRQPTYNPQMTPGNPYDKGIRKNQLSGSYGDFQPCHVKSKGQRYPTDVVYFKTAESEGSVWHPTQKPVALGRYLIRTFTNPGDLVLDNAFGSGSFLVAAALEGRSFVGIERNEDVTLFKGETIDYIHVAYQRLIEALHG